MRISDWSSDVCSSDLVTATIITDSDGARLVLKGGVGEDAAFTLTNGGGADANLARFTWDGSTGGMSQVRAAQNAVVVLDGVETSFSGNTIVDALPNVTIDLMKAAEGTTITISEEQPTTTRSEEHTSELQSLMR